MSTEEKNESYLLFVFGNFTNDNDEREVAAQVLPITTNEKLKYIFGSYHMVINMETDLPFEELKEFIYETLKSDNYEYFLMPTAEKYSVKLPNEMVQHLFDLEQENENVHIFNQVSMEQLQRESKQTDEELDMMISYFMKENLDSEDDDDIDIMLKPKESKPSMDELLEKIAESGVDALSSLEVKLLNQYSNEYE
tara:strand:+ start:385 stop:969 length:585 start_codon:yes stop_codon:yes gene_type:complete